MSAGMSTFLVLLAWALPIVIALLFMAVYYSSPPPEELAKWDEVQPD